MNDLARLEATIRADTALFSQLSARADDKAALLAAIQAQSARLGLAVAPADISARLDSLINAAANDELSDEELELVAAGTAGTAKAPSDGGSNIPKARMPNVG